MAEVAIGSIIYAPLIPDYDIHHVIFTEKRVLGVPISKLTSAAQKGAALGALGLFLAGANLFTAYGVSGLIGMGVWKDIKKNGQGNSFVRIENGSDVTPELESLASVNYYRTSPVASAVIIGFLSILAAVLVGRFTGFPAYSSLRRNYRIYAARPLSETYSLRPGWATSNHVTRPVAASATALLSLVPVQCQRAPQTSLHPTLNIQAVSKKCDGDSSTGHRPVVFSPFFYKLHQPKT